MDRMDVIDFHAHILPGADHGSASVSESLSQLLFAQNSGVTKIVATPHFYPQRDNVEKFLARRARAFEKLSFELTDDMPRIVLGAEVLMCDNIENLPGLSDLCLGGSKTLLLELPFSDFKREYCYSVSELKARGYNVILAHADRYDRENIDLMLDYGAKIQLNVDSLCGFFKDKKLYEWMSREKVVALGSDIHGADPKAYKRFVTAKKKIGDHIYFIKKSSDALWEEFIKETAYK